MTPEERYALGQRGAAALGTLLDGLGFLVANANAGDVASRKVLRQLSQLLEQVQSMSVITLPSDLS